jgi:hypothetical protein
MPQWIIDVDEKTDRAVRRNMARDGDQEGDLSEFVRQAVKKAVFWQTVDGARAFNKDVDPRKNDAALDETRVVQRK